MFCLILKCEESCGGVCQVSLVTGSTVHLFLRQTSRKKRERKKKERETEREKGRNKKREEKENVYAV